MPSGAAYSWRRVRSIPPPPCTGPATSACMTLFTSRGFSGLGRVGLRRRRRPRLGSGRTQFSAHQQGIGADLRRLRTHQTSKENGETHPGRANSDCSIGGLGSGHRRRQRQPALRHCDVRTAVGQRRVSDHGPEHELRDCPHRGRRVTSQPVPRPRLELQRRWIRLRWAHGERRREGQAAGPVPVHPPAQLRVVPTRLAQAPRARVCAVRRLQRLAHPSRGSSAASRSRPVSLRR